MQTRIALFALLVVVPLPAWAMDSEAMRYFLVFCASGVAVTAAAAGLAWWRVRFWDAWLWTFGGGTTLALVLWLVLGKSGAVKSMRNQREKRDEQV